MDKVNGALHNAVRWTKKWSFVIVVLMSLFHVGLAYIHVRESGKANFTSAAA